ncbi:MAG TPA: hypothetical protein VFC42_00835 [Methylomirabilota bacterium]|nr:hypothetical protein [Methylomirabilota bacterium]
MQGRALGGAGRAAALALFVLLAGLHLAAPRLDSDQAVTGLMGVRILQGEFPVFFWRQNHAGVPESYGAAVSFFVLGRSRPALSLVPAAAALGLMLLVYRTGAVLFGPGAGALAVVFATVTSPYVFAHYVRARAYYVEHLLLGQVVLCGAALWLARGGRLSEPARARVLLAMGLAGGLGLYCGFQIVDALLPAALALLLVDPRLPARRAALVGVVGFFLGSLPFWIYNLAHGGATFRVGVRFQGRATAAESARTVLGDLLPVVLGVREWVDTPPYLPWPAWLVVPVAVAGALALLTVRVLRGARRLRAEPARAGEALLLAAVLVTVGVVWYGRFLQVPRYLVPLAPVLALILARAGQLIGRRSPALAVAAAAVYLAAVGIPLLRDVTILWPARYAAYRAERADDEALFAFLRARGLQRAYAFDYWVAPRLTFDAGGDIIVAEPWNDRYPPFTEAVDRAPRVAYVLRTGAETLRGWLAAALVQAREAQVGPYAVFHDFGAPPPAVPLARAGWTVQASPGRGAPASVADARLETGWASATGPPRSAWLEVDLGAERTVSGLTLVTDRADRVPSRLSVLAETAGPPVEVVRVATDGVALRWDTGAPRLAPSRTLTVRFPPVHARRLRLLELARAERWSVAELFVLAPPGAGPAAAEAAAAVGEARALEAQDALEPALLRYRAAMRAAPDAPDGYDGYARLETELGLRAGSPTAKAARLAGLGLRPEARAAYAEAASALGPGRVHVELWRARAALARADGAAEEAERLDAEARAALTPARRVGAVLGRGVELVGYGVAPDPARAGEPVEVTTTWRLAGSPSDRLMAWFHFRGADQTTRFGDDYPLPAMLPDLGVPQTVSVRRRLVVPPDAVPGRYRLVAGVWDPASGRRLHRRWRGWVPTLDTTVPLGGVELVRAP